MLLRVPIDDSSIDIHDKSSPGPTGDSITGMIGVNFGMNSESKSSRLGHVGRHLLLSLTELTSGPILGFKLVFIDKWHSGIKYQLSIMLQFEVSEDSQDIL